jgi:adenosylhomocysteine nucleosidase
MPWRSLVRRWLEEKARQTVYDQVAQAGQQAAAEVPDAPRQLPPRCDVGLVFALGIELGGLEDLLSGVIVTRGSEFVARVGSLPGRGIAVFESGMGRSRAARAAELLIAGHRPAWVISTGFAGGLSPELRRGDILMADSVAEPGGGRLSIDLRVSRGALAASPGVHVGRLLTVDRIVTRADEKRALGQTHQALAVDMETWAVAEVCRQQKVRFLAVRVISDPVDEELPSDLGRLLRPTTTAGKIGAAAGTLWRRPSSVKDMLRLKQHALEASDRLARFLVSTIAQLPIEPRENQP